MPTNAISNLSRTVAKFAALVLLTAFLPGCQSSKSSPELAQAAAEVQASSLNAPDKLVLREGDTIRINFPGAPNLSNVQPIRRDGKISLPLVGEMTASGLTPADLEKKLIDAYKDQLQTKEVTVSLESSAFPVYVTGAVLRPGKIISDRPLNALEAIMEAGGFNYSRANMKNVRVIRHENGKPVYFNLNLKPTMSGQATHSFALKPSDIIYVPERFAWF
jgi:polysaccharide export outer membrane protein